MDQKEGSISRLMLDISQDTDGRERLTKLREKLQHAQNLAECLKIVKSNLGNFVEKQFIAAQSKPPTKSKDLAAQLRNDGVEAWDKRADLEESFRLYTRSIAVAPHPSVELGLAFASRSAVLCRMGYFQEALEDAEHAMWHDYPQGSLYKILMRISFCYGKLGDKALAERNRELADESLRDLGTPESKIKTLLAKAKTRDAAPTRNWLHWPDKKLPRLNSGANREAPSASAAVEIKYDNTFGCHLVATQNLKIGDVLIQEHPFAAVISHQAKWTHCTHCLKPSRALLPCPSCAWAMFCSEMCLDNATAQYHRSECAIYARFLAMEEEMDTTSLLTLRTLIIAAKNDLPGFLNQSIAALLRQPREGRTRGFNFDGQYLSDDICSVLAFPSQLDEWKDIEINTPIINAMLLALQLVKCFKLPEFEKNYKVVEFVSRLVLLVGRNTLGISEARLRPYNETSGGGLFPTLNLINHSCNPNVFYSFYGGQVVVQALEPIPAGTQLVRCYSEPYWSQDKRSRQSRLLEEHNFHCSCLACKEDWPVKEKLSSTPHFLAHERKLKSSASDYHGIAKTTAVTTVPDKYEDLATLMGPSSRAYVRLIALLHEQGKTKNRWYVEAKRELEILYKLRGNCSRQ